MRTLLCVCPPRVESLFPPVLPKSCNQSPLAFKVWFCRNSSFHCQTPSLMWVSEPSLQCVDFCDISVLQIVRHPPSSYGIWFYCDCAPPTISLCLFLCLCMLGIFFGEFQCLPVNDGSAVHCDSGALSRGSESTYFYSSILNPKDHDLIFTLWKSKYLTLVIWNFKIVLNDAFTFHSLFGPGRLFPCGVLGLFVLILSH